MLENDGQVKDYIGIFFKILSTILRVLLIMKFIIYVINGGNKVLSK